jgi:hypothetical protein
MKANDWQTRFGAKRRAIDRALLAECERAIGLEEKSAPQQPKTETPPSAANSGLSERDRIARAFGRQIH